MLGGKPDESGARRCIFVKAARQGVVGPGGARNRHPKARDHVRMTIEGLRTLENPVEGSRI